MRRDVRGAVESLGGWCHFLESWCVQTRGRNDGSSRGFCSVFDRLR
jgi:hypothetical protein